MSTPFQLGLEIFWLGRPQKAETDRTFLRLDNVVEAVRLDDSLHVIGSGYVPMIQSLVHNQVMKAEVDRAVASNSRADPSSPRRPAKLDPAEQHGYRWQGKNYGVEVVQLPVARARAMMAFMQKLPEPVHDPAVCNVCDALHPKNGEDNQENAKCARHSVLLSALSFARKSGCSRNVFQARFTQQADN